jgi:hypothetical protein
MSTLIQTHEQKLKRPDTSSTVPVNVYWALSFVLVLTAIALLVLLEVPSRAVAWVGVVVETLYLVWSLCWLAGRTNQKEWQRLYFIPGIAVSSVVHFGMLKFFCYTLDESAYVFSPWGLQSSIAEQSPEQRLSTIFTFVYSSAQALSTVSYADVVPMRWFTRLLAMAEFTNTVVVASCVVSCLVAANCANHA